MIIKTKLMDNYFELAASDFRIQGNNDLNH